MECQLRSELSRTSAAAVALSPTAAASPQASGEGAWEWQRLVLRQLLAAETGLLRLGMKQHSLELLGRMIGSSRCSSRGGS